MWQVSENDLGMLIYNMNAAGDAPHTGDTTDFLVVWALPFW